MEETSRCIVCGTQVDEDLPVVGRSVDHSCYVWLSAEQFLGLIKSKREESTFSIEELLRAWWSWFRPGALWPPPEHFKKHGLAMMGLEGV